MKVNRSASLEFLKYLRMRPKRINLNVAKTRSMSVTTKQRKKYLKISDQALQPSIREENVEVVCDTKYLGVQTDEDLT